MPDCSTCPSRLQADEVRAFFGKDFGPDVDVCAQFGHVLGRPGLDTSATHTIMVAFGKDCSKHGVDRPIGKPEYPQAQVTAPHPDVFVEIGADGPRPKVPPTEAEQANVASCRGCQNYIPGEVVREELGWYLPLCAATGRLLLPKREVHEPRKCGMARPLDRPEDQRTTTDGMSLRAEYDDAFSFGSIKVGAATYSQKAFIEPTEYPTDREVTVDEAADGIRAWRRVYNPKGTRFVELPIFRVDFFDDGEQHKIPRTGDDEHPEFYLDHQGLVYKVGALQMDLDATPCLIGQAGTGKTEFFRHLAWLMCLPFDRISVTRSTEVDDLAGKYLFEGGETVWVDGRVSGFWGKPGVGVFDEPNVGPDEVWQFIRPLTDNSKQLVLDQSKGQRKDRNVWRFFGLAMNPAHDIKYVGANEISDADGNRLATIAVGLPPEAAEREMIVQACLNVDYEIPAETLDTIMNIAGDLRAAVDNESLGASWGIRPQIAVAQYTKWFELDECYGLALANRLDPASAENIFRIVSGYVA